MKRAGGSKDLLGLLHERALLEGRDFGLRIEPSAYEFVVYEAARDRWLRMDQDHEFRHRELPKGVDFELQLDSQTVVLKPTSTEISRAISCRRIPKCSRLRRAAKSTPFRLDARARAATNARASVEGDALGKISRVSSDHVDKRT